MTNSSKVYDRCKICVHRFDFNGEACQVCSPANKKALKCYVITVARRFPGTHPRKGEPTHFVESILNRSKIHTIKLNVELWKKRIAEVNAGNAYLSLRYWKGRPYHSDQVEFFRVWKSAVEEIEILAFPDISFRLGNKPCFEELKKIYANDGLSKKDFKDWFFKTNREFESIDAAIIHFSDFKYGDAYTGLVKDSECLNCVAYNVSL